MEDFLQVYIDKIPFNCDENIFPDQRKNEILSVKNTDLKSQKFYVWKLLQRAVENAFNTDFDKFSFKKIGNKWVCDDFDFSLSHSRNLVCVGLSNTKVGVDIEGVQVERFARLNKNRLLTDNELSALNTICDKEEQSLFVNKLWCAKESVYKMNGDGTFYPPKIDVLHEKYLIKKISYEKSDYFVCVANENVHLCEYFVGEGLLLYYDKTNL